MNVIGSSCPLSAPLQPSPAEAAGNLSSQQWWLHSFAKSRTEESQTQSPVWFYCQQWWDTNGWGFIGSGWNPKVAFPGQWSRGCAWLGMGTFTWRSGNQSLIEPHLFIHIFAACHTRGWLCGGAVYLQTVAQTNRTGIFSKFFKWIHYIGSV